MWVIVKAQFVNTKYGVVESRKGWPQNYAVWWKESINLGQ